MQRFKAGAIEKPAFRAEGTRLTQNIYAPTESQISI